jgi:hypothetical protein
MVGMAKFFFQNDCSETAEKDVQGNWKYQGTYVRHSGGYRFHFCLISTMFMHTHFRYRITPQKGPNSNVTARIESKRGCICATAHKHTLSNTQSTPEGRWYPLLSVLRLVYHG